MLDFEPRLLARQVEVLGWIDALSRAAAAHGVARATGVPTDPGEWARLTDLEESALAELAAIERALERLKRGSFGICEECGEPLSFVRLERRPWVAMCDECALPRASRNDLAASP